MNRVSVRHGNELPELWRGLARGSGTLSGVSRVGEAARFFQRLFGGFKISLTVNASPGRAMEPGVHFKTNVQRSQGFQIRDTATGETKIYHSLEEVPEKYREQINRALADGHVDHHEKIGVVRMVEEGLSKRSEKITFVGSDGMQHSYNSMDEVPPDIRKLIEDAERSRNE